jgi:hypothetical protein
VLGLLLRQRLRLFWNRLTRERHGRLRVAGTVLAAFFTTGFVVFAGFNSSQFVQRLARTDPAAAGQALPILLIGVSVLTLVTSLSSAFHHLFLAADLELLLAAPVPNRSFFWLKVLEIWRDSFHVLLFQAAALLGFGQTLGSPPSYYPLALLCGVGLTVSAAALGALVTLLLARVRFGESVLGLSRVVAVLLFLPVGALGVPALGAGRGRSSLLGGQDTIQAAASTLHDLGPPPPWAPTTWISHLLVGDEAALLSAALLLAAGVLVVAASQLVYDALFQGAWERVRFAGGSTRRASAARPRFRLRVHHLSLPSGPIGSVVQKDWRTLLRDPRWRTGALVSLIALGLPAMVLFAGDPFARASHTVRFWLGLLPVPYLAYLFGSQHGAATLAYEGRNIALLRAAPVGMGRLLMAKVLGGLVLVVTVTWLGTVALAVSHGGDVLEIGAALLAATWLALGSTLAAVAGAALTAEFEADNPQRRVGCLGTVMTSALSLFFFVSNTALLGWWVARSVLSVPRSLLAWLPLLDWGLPVVALVSVGAIVLVGRMGARRLASWELS